MAPLSSSTGNMNNFRLTGVAWRLVHSTAFALALVGCAVSDPRRIAGDAGNGSGGAGAASGGASNRDTGGAHTSGGARSASGGATGATSKDAGMDAGNSRDAGTSPDSGGVEGGLSDPCIGVTCETPPATSCPDAKTRRTHASVGSCVTGACNYVATDTPCAFGCSAGVCNADPCTTVTCQTPPAKACQDSGHLISYDSVGSCSAGSCSYASHDLACTCANGACATDPCLTVTCNKPPAATCASASVRRTYAAAGTCSGGSCSYAPADTNCTFGCSAGACNADPCASVPCSSPPAAVCTDAATKRTYAAKGTCAGGACTYSSTDAKCPFGCSGGACNPDPCAACGGGTPKCKSTSSSTFQCVECLINSDCTGGLICDPASNSCENQPSCVELAGTCGTKGSCCSSSVIPGGTFNRSNDAAYPATVSPFRLDTYEVTVGRFRNFVAAFSQAMTPTGAGKNPANPNDPGWDTAWNANLPATASALATALSCPGATWTAAEAPNENRPIVCATWYEAYAFCVWDGGRLVTETEWNFAAAGGSEQRYFPWSNPPTSSTLSSDYALYDNNGFGIEAVGLKSPLGDGKWGQADLAGNADEWTLDVYRTPYVASCTNCSNLAPVGSPRTLRGGGFSDENAALATFARYPTAPGSRSDDEGFRCARTP